MMKHQLLSFSVFFILVETARCRTPYDNPAWCPLPNKWHYPDCMPCPLGTKSPGCTPCTNDTYGPECMLTCNCVSGCEPRYGYCKDEGMGCIDNVAYSGISCAYPELGQGWCRYGHALPQEDCSGLCPVNCLRCGQSDALCSSCPTGWFGQKCNHQCASGKFGRDCSQTCQCDANCNQVTGLCTGSANPYTECITTHLYGPTCQAHNIFEETFTLVRGSTPYNYLALNLTTPTRVNFVFIYTNPQGANQLQSDHSFTFRLSGAPVNGFPGSPQTTCSLFGPVEQTGPNTFRLRANCQITDFSHVFSYFQITASSVAHLSIPEVQFYECLPGSWGQDCEAECIGYCYNTSECNWRSGLCDPPVCDERFSSHIPFPNSGVSSHQSHTDGQCNVPERVDIIAPEKVVLGQSMLIFAVFHTNDHSPYYTILTTSGFNCENYAERIRMKYSIRGYVWLGLDEARDLGSKLESSMDATVPRDMNFSCYAEDDHVILLMKLIEVPQIATTNVNCRNYMNHNSRIKCVTTYPSCSYTPLKAFCSHPCGQCVSEDSNHIVIGIRQGDRYPDAWYYPLGHTFAKRVEVENTGNADGKCFNNAQKIIGTGQDMDNTVQWTEGKDIFLVLLNETLDCVGGEITHFEWTVRSHVYVSIIELPGHMLYTVETGHQEHFVRIPGSAVTFEGICRVECIVHISVNQNTRREIIKGYIKVTNSSYERIGIQIHNQTINLHDWDTPLLLSANTSSEMNEIDEDEEWRYIWTCRMSGHQDCVFENITNVNELGILGISNSSFTIPAQRLVLYTVYNFTLFAVSPNSSRPTEISSRHMMVILQNSSLVKIRCLKNCRQKLNPDENLVMECYSDMVDITNCEWSVLIDYSLASSDAMMYSSTGRQNRNFDLYSEFFNPGREYAFVLKAENTLDTTGYTLLSRVSNLAPTLIDCEVSPSEGIALSTIHTINCTGYDDDDLPLRYYLKMIENDKESILFDTENSSFSIQLPPGDAEFGILDLKVEVFDLYDSSANYYFVVKSELLARSLDGLAKQEMEAIGIIEVTEDLHKLNVVASLINQDSRSEAVNDTGLIEKKVEERNQIRKSILTALASADMQENHKLLAVADVAQNTFRGADEFTDELEDTGTEVLEHLAVALDTIPESTVTFTRQVSLTVLNSAGLLLKQLDTVRNTSLPSSGQTVMDSVKSKKKQKSSKIMSAINTVSDVVSRTLLPKQEPLSLSMDTMSLVLQKAYATELGYMNDTEVVREINGQNLSMLIRFPVGDSLIKADPSLNDSQAVYDVQNFIFDHNPYAWSPSSHRVNSLFVADISLKSNVDNVRKNIIGLPEPLQYQIPIGLDADPTSYDIEVVIERDRRNDSIFTTSNSSLLTISSLPGSDAIIILQPITRGFNFTFIVTNSTDNMTIDAIVEKGTQLSTEDSSLNHTMFIRHDNFSKGTFIGVIVDMGQTVGIQHFQSNTSQWREIERDIENYNSSTANITISVGVYNTSCLYFDHAKDSWKSEGCMVSGSSTLELLLCECNHFSVFAGGIFVAPVLVDPTDVKLFLTFFSNPVIVCTVITIWMIYFILLIWARKVDKREFSKGGVTVLQDNREGEHYSYLIGIVTGWWRHAGTTANVYMYVRGARGQSSRCAMKGAMTDHFQAGNEDWFLMSTPSSLGALRDITIWHDNSGVNPAWFLKQVVVRDIQTKQTWNFLLNDWLAVDRGRGTLKANVRSMSDEDVKRKTGYNFMLKSSKDLQSQHLWVSIFSCPPESTFTRAQRLSVALSLLLLTMLTGLMFHGIPTDDPEDQLKHGDITFSLSDIVIGIQSGLIMLPINIIIMQLFTRLSPRRKSQPFSVPKNRNDTYSHHQMLSHQEVMSSSIHPAAKGPFRFPWWFLYIAWALLILTSLISSYFIMLYGLQYGLAKSVDWLISFFTAFFQSAMVTQPLKVFIMAMLITVIFKKPVQFQQLEEERPPELKCDEEYIDKNTLQRLGVETDEVGADEGAVIVTQSLSSGILKSIREKLKLESEITDILREIILYFLFLFVVLFMVHGHQDVNTVYRTNKVIEDKFVHGLYEGDFPLDSVESTEDFWNYLSESVGGNLYPGTETISSGVSYLLGKVRLRLKRIRPGGCGIPSEMVHLYEKMPCKEEYWEGDEDETSYNKSWDFPITYNMSNSPPDHWTHQSAWQLKTIAYIGKLATYAGSGFVIEMPTDRNNFDLTLNDLQSNLWIDRGSSALFVEFNLYSPNVNLVTVVMILFEFSSIGSLLPSYQLFSTKLYMYQNGLEIFTAVCESFFVVFIMYFTYVEVKRLRKLGRTEYFSDTWSYVELSIIVLSYSAIGVFAQKMLSVSSIMNDYRKVAQSSFTNFHTAIIWHFTLSYIMAFTVLLVILKLFKLFRFNPKTNMLGDTLKFAGKSLLSTLFIIVIFLLAFAQFAVLMFGAKMYDYKDILSALMALFNFSLGVSDYIGMETANRVLGPIFFFAFCFLVNYILLVIFVAVLMVAFTQAQRKYRLRKGEKPVTWYIYNHMIRLAGFKKEKDLADL